MENIVKQITDILYKEKEYNEQIQEKKQLVESIRDSYKDFVENFLKDFKVEILISKNKNITISYGESDFCFEIFRDKLIMSNCGNYDPMLYEKEDSYRKYQDKSHGRGFFPFFGYDSFGEQSHLKDSISIEGGFIFNFWLRL